MQNSKDADYLLEVVAIAFRVKKKKSGLHAAKCTLHNLLLELVICPPVDRKVELHCTATGRHSQFLQFRFSSFLYFRNSLS